MSAEIVTMFLTIQANIKIYHWSTKSYARHKAADDLYEMLDKLFDQFIETYIGRYQRPTIGSSSLALKQHSDKDMSTYLKDSRKKIEDLQISDSELVNIRDDILGVFSQSIYVFTFV